MAPYLATATLGRFDLTSLDDVGGIPTYVAVDPQLSKGQVLAQAADDRRFFSSIYGPYPFNAVGAIVDSAQDVGYSLETQTKPIFDRMPDEATLVHEIAHMWFGDSVTLTTWPDIWLHEGFATWSEWIWSEHQGNKSAASASSSSTTRRRRTPRSGPRRPATRARPRPVQRHDLRPRRDDAAGAAGEGRRRDVLPTSCATGPRNTATAT